MTAGRYGIFLISLGMFEPRLFGGDASGSAAEVGLNTFTQRGDSPNPEGASAPSSPIDSNTPLTAMEPGPAKASSRVRRALLERFPYDPAARPKAAKEISPILVRAQPAPGDAEVVVMSQIEVTERVRERDLTAAIASWRDPGPRNDSRFGTGVHQKDLGKVRASVVTILYVPVFFGLSW